MSKYLPSEHAPHLSAGEIIALVALIVGILVVITPMIALSRSFFLLIVLAASLYLCWRSPWPRKKRTRSILTVVLSFTYVTIVILLFVVEAKTPPNTSAQNVPTNNPAIVSGVAVWAMARVLGLWGLPWRWILLGAILSALPIIIRFRSKQSSTIKRLSTENNALKAKLIAKAPQSPSSDQSVAMSDNMRGCEDEWLHEALLSDKKSIGELVKVFIADWNPEFSKDVLRPYIDFRFAISNISICAVTIEDSLSGYITVLKEGAEKRSAFREAPCFAPNQELYVLPRKPNTFVVRQYLDRVEANEIEGSGKETQFWLHELQVYFYGKGIDRTRLYTRQVVTKERRWVAEPALYCGYDEEQLVTAKIESLAAENTWLKSRPDQQPKPTLTFEIDEIQSQVHIDTFKETGRITAKVRLRCEKTISDTMSVKDFHAALLLEHKIDGSVVSESVVIQQEGAQVVMSEPDMAIVKMNNGWKIDEPLTAYRWFSFFLDTPSTLGEPYREHFLRVTMEVVGQEPFSVDFYAESWRDAQQGNSSIRLRKK